MGDDAETHGVWRDEITDEMRADVRRFFEELKEHECIHDFTIERISDGEIVAHVRLPVVIKKIKLTPEAAKLLEEYLKVIDA